MHEERRTGKFRQVPICHAAVCSNLSCSHRHYLSSFILLQVSSSSPSQCGGRSVSLLLLWYVQALLRDSFFAIARIPSSSKLFCTILYSLSTIFLSYLLLKTIGIISWHVWRMALCNSLLRFGSTDDCNFGTGTVVRTSMYYVLYGIDIEYVCMYVLIGCDVHNMYVDLTLTMWFFIFHILVI